MRKMNAATTARHDAAPQQSGERGRVVMLAPSRDYQAPRLRKRHKGPSTAATLEPHGHRERNLERNPQVSTVLLDQPTYRLKTMRRTTPTTSNVLPATIVWSGSDAARSRHDARPSAATQSGYSFCAAGMRRAAMLVML